VELHHLQYQKDADEKGFIKSFHKNHKANLINICSKCHDEIHNENKKYITCSGCKGNHYQDLFGETVLCMRCKGEDKFEESEDEQS